MAQPSYHIKINQDYPNILRVTSALGKLKSENPNLDLVVGYHIPQPKYKSWVPNWLVRLITK